MHEINLQHGHGDTAINMGRQLISDGTISQQCADMGSQFVVVTDSNVSNLYAKTICQQLQQQGKACLLIEIPAGEGSKTRATKQSIEDQMLQAQCGRDAVMLAIGGGVVTDLAGFVAATYCRGIKVIYVPTTLLAMVDAAIGGKTGVNTPEGKNLIGSFYQPQSVFCDMQTLHTLPSDELANGLVESLKHALIRDSEFYHTLDAMLDDFTRGHELSVDQLQALVITSCQIKCDVVALDEYEQGGIRQLLNYGHTVAHAIECELAYAISHGQAVLAGLWVASRMANLLGYLKDNEFDKIKKTLTKINYSQPIKLDAEHIPKLQQHMLLDKKSINQQARFVLLDSIGTAHVEHNTYSMPVDDDVVAHALTDFLQEMS